MRPLVVPQATDITDPDVVGPRSQTWSHAAAQAWMSPWLQVVAMSVNLASSLHMAVFEFVGSSFLIL